MQPFVLSLRDQENVLRRTFVPGPADSSIFTEQKANCIATDMEAHGVRWIRPDAKGTSSRKNGWELMRRMLFNSGELKERISACVILVIVDGSFQYLDRPTICIYLYRLPGFYDLSGGAHVDHRGDAVLPGDDTAV